LIGGIKMDKQAIQEKVIDVIKENCQFNKDEIELDADLRDNYGIDSLAIVNILVDLEDAFNITIDSGLLSYDSFSNTRKIIDYINATIN
jgi:acyl carrier protein